MQSAPSRSQNFYIFTSTNWRVDFFSCVIEDTLLKPQSKQAYIALLCIVLTHTRQVVYTFNDLVHFFFVVAVDEIEGFTCILFFSNLYPSTKQQNTVFRWICSCLQLYNQFFRKILLLMWALKRMECYKLSNLVSISFGFQNT